MTEALSELIGRAVGRRIRYLRQRVGLPQAEVARRVGSHREIIGRIESGRHLQSFDVLRQLARALGLPLCEVLLEGIDWAPIDAAARRSLRKVAA